MFNKVDLIDEKKLEEKIKKFENKINKKVVILSTLKKYLISSLKSELISHVS